MVIDMHSHFAAWGGARIPEDTPRRTLDMLKANGVDGLLILPLMNLFSSCPDHAPENDDIFEYCRQAPGRLFAGFSVNPLAGGAALDEIRRCASGHSARVLKLHPWLQGFSVSSPEMDAVAALCRELGVAILFHDGTPPYTHPLQLARLCRDFPGLTVISGHAGLEDLWREAVAAALRYPDYVLCLSGPRELAMREIIGRVPARQICVGADFSTSEKDDAVLWFRWRSFRDACPPGETRRIIEEETPARILGLA